MSRVSLFLTRIPTAGLLAALLIPATALAGPDGGSDGGSCPAGQVGSPLSMCQLDLMAAWLDCVDACHAGDPVTQQTCVAGCGPSAPYWLKDGVPPVTRNDYTLAELEIADDGTGTEICYRDNVNDFPCVVPAPYCADSDVDGGPQTCLSLPVCTGADCPDGGTADGGLSNPACPPLRCEYLRTPSQAACSDVGGDGVPAWLKSADGLNPNQQLVTCTDNTSCNFYDSCTTDPILEAPTCSPRTCAGGACTAFHLSLVAADDQQVIIDVSYDYSPIPAQVLDLHVDFDQTNLVLQNAQPLPNLTNFGLSLAETFPAMSEVRLVVYDENASIGIPTGPIVELTFQRIGPAATTVSFSTDPNIEQDALAPLQGNEAVQAQLSDATLWGPPVAVPAVSSVIAGETQMLLWYGFESPAPALAYVGYGVPDAGTLCGMVPECNLAANAAAQAKVTGQLATLQAGVEIQGGVVPGVTREGAFFDGTADHIEFPVQVLSPLDSTGQSFSYSMWFYSQGDTGDVAPGQPQLLFSHIGPDERTRFGLILEVAPSGGGAQTLSFFTGDLLNLADAGADVLPPGITRTTIAATVPLLTWHDVGFSVDAHSGLVSLYFDGVAAGTVTLSTAPPALACPGFANGSDVLLPTEGNFLGGVPPETIWYSTEENGTFGIGHMDVNGLSPTDVIRDGQFNYRDPSASPVLGLLAYSSDTSGDDEIWISSLNGQNPVQVTSGFGDPTRGLSARRPRWAPDGSGLVFESNIYTAATDNTNQSFLLYYLPFDPVQDQFLQGGVDSPSPFVYANLLASQTINTVRLPGTGGNNQNAWWLSGAGSGTLGTIVFDSSDSSFGNHAVQELVLPATLPGGSPTVLSGLLEQSSPDGGTGPTPTVAARLLSAYQAATVSASGTLTPTTRLLYSQDSASLSTAPLYTLRVSSNSGATSGISASAQVVFSPPAGYYSSTCWDLNLNGICDLASEDLNQDGRCSVLDCYPSTVSDLLISEDPGYALHSFTQASTLVAGKTGTAQQDGSYVRVDVSSSNTLPFVPGAIGTVTFTGAPTAGLPFTAYNEILSSVPAIATLPLPAGGSGTGGGPIALAGLLDAVQDGVLAPDGNSVLLLGTSAARPLLLRSPNLQTLQGGVRVDTESSTYAGLSWVEEQRYFPCNWVGAYRHPTTKQYQDTLVGGLDDIKVWAGVRPFAAFQSEALRGEQLLQANGESGPGVTVPSQVPQCSSSADCPAYHICEGGSCVVQGCNPSNPYSCDVGPSGTVGVTGPTGAMPLAGVGRCVQKPASIAGQNTSQADEFVCESDCVSDQQCYSQTCQDGPCLYCQQSTHTCIECQETVQTYGSFQVTSVVGCPDSNAYQCVNGACVSHCYTTVDGQSIYQCDPNLEYCQQGQCVLRNWDWPQLAPSSLSGLTETVYSQYPFGMSRSVAIGERTSVVVNAFGSSDRGLAPELVVEGQFSDGTTALYGGQWFRIGKALVYNRTESEAGANPYQFDVPHPITALRMRMTQSPYWNFDGSSDGLGASDNEFCEASYRQFIVNGGTGPDPCDHRPPGSFHWLGFDGAIPDALDAQLCFLRGDPNCPTAPPNNFSDLAVSPANDPLRSYLPGGYPAIIVTKATVGGNSAPSGGKVNRGCSYEGGTSPLDPSVQPPRQRMLWYGDVSQEVSPEKQQYCGDGGTCQPVTGNPLVDFTSEPKLGGLGLLNCDYNDGTFVADIEYDSLPYVPPPLTSGAITENGTGCFVEVNQNVRVPCYEAAGGDVSVDPVNDEVSVFNTLELSIPKGFGYSTGYTSVPLPTFPLSVHVTGLSGTAPVIVQNGTDRVSLTAAAPAGQFATPVKQGQSFSVQVVTQPNASAGVFCVASQGTGYMPAAALTVNIVCSPMVGGTGTLIGLAEGSVTVQLTTSQFVSGGQVLSSGQFNKTLSSNGSFSFPQSLLPGTSWAAAIVVQPTGAVTESCTVSLGGGPAQGFVPAGGITGILVDCQVVAPRHLGGTVSGLPPGSTVGIQNSVTGEDLTLQSNGAFQFSEKVVPGAVYTVSVVSQPPLSSGAQCTVSAASATMPNQDVTSVQVICSSSAAYTVSFMTVGLVGSGLTLQLNGSESLTVAAGSGTQTFQTQLLDGAFYAITITGQPIAPTQVCGLNGGTGVIAGADVTTIVVTCGTPSPTLYTVGGTVTGLAANTQAPGLKLSNNSDVISITASGQFGFDLQLPFATTWSVTVSAQPQNPVQYCTVTSGATGLVAGTVNSIAVTCIPAAAVALSVGNLTSLGISGSASLGISARLISTSGATSGQLLAETSPSETVPATGGPVILYPAADAADSTPPPPAVVPPGSYLLYVMLNSQMKYDSLGAPVWIAGDLGTFEELTLPAGTAPQPVSLASTQFKTMIQTPVVISNSSNRSIPNGSTPAASCYFSPHISSSDRHITLPPTTATPVLAAAQLTCQNISMGNTCWANGQATTDVNQPIFELFPYDVTCWADLSPGNSTNPDNILDPPDYLGFSNGVLATTPFLPISCSFNVQ